MPKLQLTDRELAYFQAVASKVDENTLYHALHHVGDDVVKTWVDQLLETVLDEQTYRKVAAAFYIAADDDNPNNPFFEESDEETNV